MATTANVEIEKTFVGATSVFVQRSELYRAGDGYASRVNAKYSARRVGEFVVVTREAKCLNTGTITTKTQWLRKAEKLAKKITRLMLEEKHQDRKFDALAEVFFAQYAG